MRKPESWGKTCARGSMLTKGRRGKSHCSSVIQESGRTSEAAAVGMGFQGGRVQSPPSSAAWLKVSLLGWSPGPVIDPALLEC